MRNACIDALMTAAATDERIWLLCGDLGFSVLEPFAERYPGRFCNCGVAEQNMTGVAAGLALCGKVVFTYSIANFPVMRPFEQLRNDVCYHRLPVKVIAVGGGMAYGSLGYSHHGIEDLAVMRALPEMAVFAPGDPHEMRACVTAALDYPGPCYLRVGKAGEPNVHPQPVAVAMGKALEVCSGTDVTFCTTGGVLAMAMTAAQDLAAQGIAARVLSFTCLAPLDEDALVRAAAETAGIITVEEHGWGGLGTLAAECLALHGVTTHLRIMRLPNRPIVTGGSQDALRTAQGLSVTHLVAAAQHICASTIKKVPSA